MARPIWTGALAFGLVNVPVKVYAAIRRQEVHFHQLEEGSGDRIRYRRVSERTGKEVPPEHIVKGYEISKGHYVTVTDEELERFRPESTRTIELGDFVELPSIDPIYFDHSYYLAPDGKTQGAKRAYDLLAWAMEDRRKVGIGQVVIRNKQYLAAVRAAEGALVMSTMLFADEVVPRTEIDELPAKPGEVSEREAQMASQLVESLTGPFEPSRYTDTYRSQVINLLKRKAKGEVVTPAEAPGPPAGKTVDLMAALEASLAEGRNGRPRPERQASPSDQSSRKAGGGQRDRPGPQRPPAGELDGRSRDELYEQAQRRGIEGRSKMSRGQLIEALQEEHRKSA